MEKTEWLAQARKGLLEYSVLSIIHRHPVYGYELISTLNEQESLSTTEGTIYPLLKRLEKGELISSFWKETVAGTPPRKYYKLTENGLKTLQMINTEWVKLVQSIENIKESEAEK